MRYLILIGLLVLTGALSAQPISPASVSSNRGHYIFTVVQPAAAAETRLWTFGAQDLTTHRIIDHRDTSSIVLNPVSYPHLRTFFTTEAHTGADAGATESITAVDPLVLEVLHYPALLNPEQRQLTESYLALKHGLTLSQALPTNYLRSVAGGSQPVWTATAAPDYRARIFGLVHDSGSRLTRSVGQSALAPDLLRLEWTRLPDTLAYLVMADNDAPTARTAGSRQLQRSWRVETTGSVPATTFRFDTRRFFDRATPGETWQLQVRFSDESSTSYTATAGVTGQLIFRDLQLPPDQTVYLSLAASTPAPLSENSSLFTTVTVSPNPVHAGTPVQLRAALERPLALSLTINDLNGRLISNRRLPLATHHLTEITFPAPGVYTLHLRPRPGADTTAGASLKVVVH